jgi:hypothetical protein
MSWFWWLQFIFDLLTKYFIIGTYSIIFAVSQTAQSELSINFFLFVFNFDDRQICIFDILDFICEEIIYILKQQWKTFNDCLVISLLYGHKSCKTLILYFLTKLCKFRTCIETRFAYLLINDSYSSLSWNILLLTFFLFLFLWVGMVLLFLVGLGTTVIELELVLEW